MPAASLTPLKYVVGIDIAKDTFVACFGRIEATQQLRFGKQATFPNTIVGFVDLLSWTTRQHVTMVNFFPDETHCPFPLDHPSTTT